jgi:hypothetical protein
MILPGELVMMQADVIDETMQYLQQKLEHQALGREIDLDSAIGKPAVAPQPDPSLEPTKIVQD